MVGSSRSFLAALAAVVGLAGCQSSGTVELGDDEVGEQTVDAQPADTGDENSDGDENSSIGSEADQNSADPDGDTTSKEDGEEIEPIGTGADLPDSAPDSFWAITTETYELVEVDSRTGEIMGRYGAWGEPNAECDADEECLFQGLNEVALDNDGKLWLSDCCEPAVGNLFQLTAGEQFTTDSFAVFGSHPVPSPSGDLIAFAGLQVTIIADTSGQQLAVLGQTDEAEDGPSLSYQPVAWIDDDNLVVRLTGDVVDNLVVFDLSDPESPRQTGPNMGGVISHTDAAVRADGMIFALARSYRGDDAGEESDLAGWVFDPSTGDVIAETDLPDDIWEIDYDATGTYLLTVGADGIVRFYGAGRSGELADGFVAVSW